MGYTTVGTHLQFIKILSPDDSRIWNQVFGNK